MGEELSDELEQLEQKERWIQNMADAITDGRRINRETAVHGARWASLWIDDYRTLFLESSPQSSEEIKHIIDSARVSALEKCEGLPRYPGGVPSLRVIIAAHDAFCLSFGEEADEVRELLQVRPEE